jgi:3-oxoacyl-(acyl-carrier-protein) synthase
MKRVVVTGMGAVAPNGVGLDAFFNAMKHGRSGVRPDPEMARLGFSCQVSAKPEIPEGLPMRYFTEIELRNFDASGILYGVIAAMDAWRDAKLGIADAPDWGSGTVFGSGTSGIGKFRESIYRIDEGQVRRLGSGAVAQTMNSGVSAFIAGKLGFGNQVTSNSAACTTGTESVLMAFDRIRAGNATRMLAGSTGDSGPYIWGGFDAMRVCSSRHNDSPEKASRPMSASAAGFVPGSGAGALVLEELESALRRGVRIYAEILGGCVNSGGQRGGGSMTAPNPQAVIRCISDAVKRSGIGPEEIDLVNGHLTATAKDPLEVSNWSAALGLSGNGFPLIQSTKSLIGHCLTGAGSLECVASVLQLYHNVVFPNANAEDLHPEIEKIVPRKNVNVQFIEKTVKNVAKASFGFGDVNACVIFTGYKPR